MRRAAGFEHKKGLAVLVGVVGCLVVELLTGAPEPRAPLHEQIDQAIESTHAGPLAPIADDAEFARRVHLDLTGMIPSAADARSFLDDQDPAKRAKLVDHLLASAQFARHMQYVFDIMWMERRAGKHVGEAEWREYLRQSFAENKPYDQLAWEILSADGVAPGERAAAKFYLDRDVEVNHLTRDVGRLFFGVDLQCAQCHDHPNVDDYLQTDYYGLYAFLNRSFIFTNKQKKSFMAERADGEASFKSVFTEVEGKTAPRLPGSVELPDPKFDSGKYKTPPQKHVRAVPRYSRRTRLALEATSGENGAFNRNIANRLWAVMLGRGLVDPPDFHHAANPPTHPALLETLGREFAAMDYDTKQFLREIALSRTYQRSSVAPNLSLAEDEANKRVADQQAEVERLKSVVSAARKAWGDSKGQVDEAREILEASGFPDAAHAERIAKDTAYQAVVELVELQKRVVDQQRALELAGQAIASTNKAAEELSKDKALLETAKKLSDRLKKLSEEITKTIERLPDAETYVLTCSAKLKDTRRAAQEASTNSRPLLTQVADLESREKQLREAFFKARKESEQTSYAVTNAETLVEYCTLRDQHQKTAEEVKSLAAKRNAANEKLAALTKELEKAKGALSTAEKTDRDSTAAVEKSKNSLGAKEGVARALNDARAKLDAALRRLPGDKELTAGFEALDKRADQTNSEVAALKKSIGELTKKINKAKEEQKSAQAALDKADAEFKAASEEFQKVEVPYRALVKQEAKERSATDEAAEEVLDGWRRRYAMASLRPLSPEQYGWSALRALGLVDRELTAGVGRFTAEKKTSVEVAYLAEKQVYERLLGKLKVFIDLYAGLPGAPPGDFEATAAQALFLLNSKEVQNFLKPETGNLTERLVKIDDPAALAEELYLSVLSRRPNAAESEAVVEYLVEAGGADGAAEEASDANKEARVKRRTAIAQDLVWALFISAEFRFNH